MIDLDIRKEIEQALGEEIDKLPEAERKMLDEYIAEKVKIVESLQDALFNAENSKEGIVNTIASIKKLLEEEDVKGNTKNISK